MENDDGKFVVIKNGQRASGLFEKKEDAEAEAQKQRAKLAEQQGGQAQPSDVKVMQNLLG
jgi:hypothetical protein